MTEFTLSRRQFLRSTTRIGVTLALTTGLCRPVRPVQAQETSLISIPQGTDILSDSDVQNWIAAGLGGLWVAGNFLNFFARNLVFENLPAALKLKYLLAGGEYKSMPAAKAIWETIPAPIRAGGPEALWKFHKGKVLVPYHSQVMGWANDRGERDLVVLSVQQKTGRPSDPPARTLLGQTPSDP